MSDATIDNNDDNDNQKEKERENELLKEDRTMNTKEGNVISLPVAQMEVLLDKLEKEGIEKVQKAWHSEVSPLTLNASNIFLKIMQDSADNFKEQTGRNMTYSEMRRLYG